MRKFVVVLLMFGIFVTAGISKTKSTKSAKSSKSACKKTAFTPACTLPFDAIKQTGLAIDKTCGEPGCADPTTAQGMQNAAKNNFCATGAPVTVAPNMLAQLMAAAQAKGVTSGSESQVPADRSVLKGFTIGGVTLGEGTVVRMAAFVIEAHYADVSSGESVNCKIGSSAVGAAKAQAANDIHIALGTSYGADECGSVTRNEPSLPARRVEGDCGHQTEGQSDEAAGSLAVPRPDYRAAFLRRQSQALRGWSAHLRQPGAAIVVGDSPGVHGRCLLE